MEELRLGRMTAIVSCRGSLGSSSAPDAILNPKLDTGANKGKKPKKLKLKGGEEAEYEQEEKVLRHFCRQIHLAMTAYKSGETSGVIARKWWRVGPTAIVYFRRFYAHNSLRIHDPRVMVVACLLVASKVEESIVDIRELHKIHPKLVEQDLLEAEYVLLKALGAQLNIHHPHNLVQTYVAALKRKFSVERGKTIDIDTIDLDSVVVGTWMKLAEEHLELLYLTAAPLLYSPRDLAIVAMEHVESSVLKSAKESIVQSGLLSELGQEDKESLVASVKAAKDGCASLFREAQACANKEELASVGAWVKLSKGGWPKPKKSDADDATSMKMEPNASRGEDGDEAGGPPRKRIKEENV